MLTNLLQKVKTRNWRSPLLEDSFWALIGSFVGKGLSMLAGILVAKFLGKESYGEYGLLQSTLLTIGIFSTFGLGYTATRFVAMMRDQATDELNKLCRTLLGITLVSGSVITILVFSLAPSLAELIKAPHLTLAIRICSIIVLLNALTLTQVGILSGRNRYKTIARNNLYSGIVVFLFSTILTYRYQFDGAMTALLIMQLFNCLINAVSIGNIFRRENTTIAKVIGYKEIINFSLPVALQESLVFLCSWISSLVLIYLAGYGEVGLFSAATQWSVIILFIPGVLRNVTLSHLSGSKDEKEQMKVMRLMLLVNFCSTFLPFLFIVLFRNYIEDFYGASYQGLAMVMLVLNASTIPNSMSNVYVQEFMALNKNWKVLFCRLTKDVLAILGTYYLITSFDFSGAISAAICATVTAILYLALLVLLFKRVNEHTA